jgi:hypothetical protein
MYMLRTPMTGSAAELMMLSCSWTLVFDDSAVITVGISHVRRRIFEY